MNDVEKIDWIDRYLKNQLQGEELITFEKKIQEDIAFKNELALQKRLIQHIKVIGLKEMFSQIENSVTEQNPNNSESTKASKLPDSVDAPPTFINQNNLKLLGIHKNRQFFSYAIAATISLLIMAGAYFIFNKNTPSFHSPHLTTIPYQGNDVPPFPYLQTKGSAIPQYIPVIIYTSTEATEKYYTFGIKDTLRLYGAFNPLTLLISYQKQNEKYTLRIDSNEFALQRVDKITPLHLKP